MANANENTVDRKNQISGDKIYFLKSEPGADKKETKVLIFGNSITRHGTKPEIGWMHDFGMAASKKENDYVHVLFGKMCKAGLYPNFLVSHASYFESNFYKDEALNFLSVERDFKPDILILRLGDNVHGGENDGLLIPSFESLISACATKTTRVIVTGSYFVNENIEPLLKELSDKNGFKFVDLSDISLNPENTGGKENFWHEGVAMHPGDKGMRIIADRLFEAIND